MEDTFTIGTRPVVRYMGYACLVAAALGTAVYFWVMRTFPGPKWLEMLLVILIAVLAVEGIAVLVLFQRNQLSVSGERIFFVSNGRTGTFQVADVSFVTCSQGRGRTLFDKNGRVLVRLSRDMEDLLLLDRYFLAHHIPVRNL